MNATRNERDNRGATKVIAGFVADISFDALPPSLVELGKLHILDGLGLLLAGSVSDPARILQRYVQDYCVQAGGARLWGTTLRAPARFAALANSVALHADDFDDTNQPTGGAAKTGGVHTTAVILPTVLALAEQRRAGGRELIAAFHAGTEIACKLNDAIFPRHYEAGFHSTGTIGTLGAAVAAAKLHGATPADIENAIGLAASAASGLRENFGTMTKPFHAGRAAEAGIVAVDLSAMGFTAAAGILEAERGFFSAFADGFDAGLIIGRLGKPWALQNPGSLMKAYPSGAVGHAAMSLLEDLIAEHDIMADQVKRLVVTTQPKLKNILLHPVPSTGLEAKFSLPFAMAILLLDRRAGLSEFTDAVVQSERVGLLLDRIEHRTYKPEPDYSNVTAFLEIELIDGRVITGRADYGKGSPQRPLSVADITGKFMQCAAYGGVSDTKANRLAEMVLSLETLPDVSVLSEELFAIS